MNTKHIITLTALLAGNTVHGVTTFATDPTALAVAKWDTWTFASSVPATGSQGAAGILSGGLVTSSEVTTTILQGYDSPPGGFLGNPDTYYFHNGAATWNSNLLLSSPVSFVRVSYSLVGFGGGPPSAYGQAPAIAGASILQSGVYDAAGVPAFYTDLELDASATDITASFGDALFPGFPGSFRSVDAIQLEVFNTVPEAIPEPSVGILSFFGGLFLLRRKRR